MDHLKDGQICSARVRGKQERLFKKKIKKEDDCETDEHAQEHVVPPGSTVVQTEGILTGGTTNQEIDASITPTQTDDNFVGNS